MGFFSGIRRRVKKLIPKEVRPFIPYAAALIPGANLGLGAFAKSNPAMYKALMAGGTKFLTDDEADLKDVGITATLAAAPTAVPIAVPTVVRSASSSYPLRGPL